VYNIHFNVPTATDGLDDVYGTSLALLTDLYQLTMACGYWKAGTSEREAVFHLTFRKSPFGGGFAIAAGIAPALAFLRRMKVGEDDVAYLKTLTDSENKPLFPQGFLDYLAKLELAVTVDAVPEGSVVFPHEPILRVRGPIAHAQIVETALLTMINFQTLVATKASRVCLAARGAPVIEFGLRRAQGLDGGLGSSRAAYIGGCAATSNVLAGKLLGIPLRGTHAHSWVMFYGDELQAFRAYADALPGNTTFLVDTYDTVIGIRNAIKVGLELRAKGHELGGVRLDSGDLAHLSAIARDMLDEAGFPNAKIVASNDLDENIITSLHEQGSKVDVWGVGTKLVTAYDQPALGGVYKLGATFDPDGTRHDAIKLSEQPIKISNPGTLQVRRLRKGNTLVGDIIYDDEHGLTEPGAIHDIQEPSREPFVPEYDHGDDLLQRAFENGRILGDQTIEAARARCAADLEALSPRTRRFLNPQPYAVGLDPYVHEHKLEMIAAARAHERG